MRIITPEIGTKQIEFIPRSESFTLTAYLHSESENKDLEFAIISYWEDEYFKLIQFDTDQDLLENNFYMLTLKKNGQAIYKEKIFVTSQTSTSFSVNNEPNGTPSYTGNITNNEFIIYE